MKYDMYDETYKPKETECYKPEVDPKYPVKFEKSWPIENTNDVKTTNKKSII